MVAGRAGGKTRSTPPDEEPEMPDPHLLAADVDRSAVVTRLDASLTDGRLTLAEHEDRSARAHAARARRAARRAVGPRRAASLTGGRLTRAEYEDRSARAHAARTYGELTELTADLPSAARPAAPEPRGSAATRAAPRGAPHR